MSFATQLKRTAALSVVLAAFAISAPAFAAPIDPTQPSGPPNSTVTLDSNGHVISRTPDSGMSMQGYGQNYNAHNQNVQPAMAPAQPHHMMHAQPVVDHSPAAMKEHVEERIKHLHAKLGITKDQEPQWNEVAQAMRDSEANVSNLIQQRHQNAGSMNAVDDLESYQEIAQAHADGLKKVNASFKSLYDEMSPEQKKNADSVFDHYEGHGDMGHHDHDHKHQHNKTM